jgi:hypothetical protein
MIQEREQREVVANKMREDQRKHDAIMRAHWRARPWHQKLRYWVLGALLLMALFGSIFGFPKATECVESSRWEFC